MRISFMTFACPELSFDEVVALARRHDYDGIEFRCDAGHRHGVEITATAQERREYRRRLADAGIRVACLATSLRFAENSSLEQAPARIELAADMGAPGLRIFCGPFPDNLSVQEAIRLVAANIDAMADVAAPSGVRLWLETHDYTSLGVRAAAIVSRLGHPSVGINWDVLHPYRSGEPLDVTWDVIAPYVEHCHFHDALLRPGEPTIVPIGEGELPLQEMYALLRDAGYSGYLSGEWFGKQLGPTPDDSLRNYREGILRLEERYQQQRS